MAVIVLLLIIIVIMIIMIMSWQQSSSTIELTVNHDFKTPSSGEKIKSLAVKYIVDSEASNLKKVTPHRWVRKKNVNKTY